MDDMEDFYWRKPTEYRSYYHMKMYGYLDLICCVLTIVSNTLVIMVLSRKNMSSPVNTIFTHLAITESLAIIAYTPRTWHEFFRVERCSIPQHRTYIWEMISWHSYVLAFLFRHIGVWMGMMLAIWRYIAVIHPLRERNWSNMRITKTCIVVGYIIMGFPTIAQYLSTGVEPAVKLLDRNGCSTSNYTIGQNITIYEFQVPLENYLLLYKICFLVYGIFIKILPSIVLIAISYKLIVSLIKVNEHRKKMATAPQRKDALNMERRRKIDQHTDRTTKTLLIILLLFIMGEVPHGIFSIITAYYGPKFFWKHYFYGMEIFNSLTHVSESFNFLIYYAMSYQFRNTFKALFDGSSNDRNTVTSQKSNSSLNGIDKMQGNCDRSPSATTIGSACA